MSYALLGFTPRLYTQPVSMPIMVATLSVHAYTASNMQVIPRFLGALEEREGARAETMLNAMCDRAHLLVS
eukprot:3763180-Rhodomonas_salina.3